MSALVVAGLVATGSTTHSSTDTAPATAPEALLAASKGTGNTAAMTDEAQLSRTVGLLPVAPETPRKLTAMTPPTDGAAPFAGLVPLRDIALPATGGALGIPEIVLAAYRNAELALESSAPGCGVSWNLLAGIGRIESGHASSGRTDAAGTTVTPIFGPALDGTLPGNEIIKAADGGYVRALGPMQFLPGTWSQYAADGNGDGVSDPHNVFDAALAAGKYLCSGNMNLRDPQQELRAVLRYNNSMSYAANVLSWSSAYRTGGTPAQVAISPELIAPGTAPIQAGPDMVAANTKPPATPEQQRPTENRAVPAAPTPTEVMITIPGLPPIPCGIFCPPPVPPPADPCAVQAVPAPMARPLDAAVNPNAPQTYGAAEPGTIEPGDTEPKQPVCTLPQPAEQAAPAAPAAPRPPEVAKTPEPELPPPAEAPAEPAPVPPPAITLPFNIVIPLPPA
ncbi:lytic transglycosylase domain-containing protein [Nocardia goodfellowii]|uniref:Membrane-bound lytic murein transglycosylase B n=1 Tax=Nocardia goodfellowii TaxID=882446 RepID=A0ABS4QC73_9NOCA|nr:lytic murein transglycosylase [Nocardia goodfellowii]MBP2189301.1 membrane-bound lytic murein transglycosylase B [Nocardia goodfellowii]